LLKKIRVEKRRRNSDLKNDIERADSNTPEITLILKELKKISTLLGPSKSQSKDGREEKESRWGQNGLEIDFASREVQNFNSS